jgi:hypothetical protein
MMVPCVIRNEMSLKDSPSEGRVSPRETQRTGIVGTLSAHFETWSHRYIEMRVDAVTDADS